LRPAFASLLICFTATFVLAQGKPQPANKTLELAPQSAIRYADPWKPSGVKYANVHELVLVSKAAPAGEVEVPSARILITSEQRTSQQDAINRLRDIAKSRPGATIRYVQIGGWPAVVLEFTEPLPNRGAPQKMSEQEREPAPENIMVHRAIAAVAADTTVVRFDITLAPDTSKSVLQQAEDIASSTSFPKKGNPDDVRKSILDLQRPFEKPVAPTAPKPVPEASLIHPPKITVGESRELVTEPGSANSVYGGLGELEVIASSDAKDIVIAGNGGVSYSNDRGGRFQPSSIFFGPNDATLARGASGDFYLGVIANPSGTGAQGLVSGCTNAVSQSADKGVSFVLQGYSVVCPTSGANVCFPDQPHIAADAVNKASGKDQIYAVWRNFTPLAGPAKNCNNFKGGTTASISCSKDNGATWTTTLAINSGGDLPRIAVGKDGSVYVVTLSGNGILLDRYSSCSSGLLQQAGYPVTVVNLTGQVACPVPGLDRCNNGNTLTSPTVAPDPSDSKRVFVTYAQTDNSNGEQILTYVSNDYGQTFPNGAIVTTSTGIRRFMPWSCVAQGRSWVGWYDRKAAKARGVTNDLTDFRLSSSDGTQVGNSYNLSQNPDPQCASGWPCGARSTQDSESCTVQPELAGSCLNSKGKGSGKACDFSSTVCPSGETCQTGGGCPKYGDYNGIACAGDYVIAAWASAKAPKGITAPAGGINVFSEVMTVAPVCKVVAGKCASGTVFGVTVTCTGENIGIKYNSNCQLAGEPSPCYSGFDGSTSATASFEGTIGSSNSVEACTTDGPFQNCINPTATAPSNQCPSGGSSGPPPPECPEGYRWCTKYQPPRCMLDSLCTYDPLHPPPQAPN
jgi:hypothetical protein